MPSDTEMSELSQLKHQLTEILYLMNARFSKLEAAMSALMTEMSAFIRPEDRDARLEDIDVLEERDVRTLIKIDAQEQQWRLLGRGANALGVIEYTTGAYGRDEVELTNKLKQIDSLIAHLRICYGYGEFGDRTLDSYPSFITPCTVGRRVYNRVPFYELSSTRS